MAGAARGSFAFRVLPETRRSRTEGREEMKGSRPVGRRSTGANGSSRTPSRDDRESVITDWPVGGKPDFPSDYWKNIPEIEWTIPEAGPPSLNS